MTRRSKPLTSPLTNRLLAYAAAAGAVAASPSLANAEVVYTPIQREVHSSFILDLNHDGIDDFQIFSSDYSDQGEVKVLPARGNRILAAASQTCGPRSYSPAAAPLPVKTVIGPDRPFQAAATCMAFYDYSFGNGPWLDIKKRYLGFAFLIDGKEHFGWARLNLGRFRFNQTAEILGYAYETIPGKPILAGDEGSQTAQPATLGALSAGAPALNSWRKEGSKP
jgi:hypothetical protein